MNISKSVIKSLILGYLLTFLFLLILMNICKKELISESLTNTIINVIYITGSFIGALYLTWAIKRHRILWGMGYGIIYYAIILFITFVTEGNIDSIDKIVISLIIMIVTGAVAGFVSP